MNEVRNMKIDLQGIADRNQWEAKGYRLPQYDIVQMKKATQENPLWVHFGAGNLFRAFHAAIAQRMLNDGRLDRGIIVAEGFDYEIIDRVYATHDNLGIAVTLKADGTVDKEVIGSVAEALPLDSGNPAAYTRLKEIFTKDSLQMITFTITEKGYCLTDAKGEYLPEVMADFANGPEKPASYMGKVAALLHARFCAGENRLQWSAQTTAPTMGTGCTRLSWPSRRHGRKTKRQMRDFRNILIPERLPFHGA